MTDFRFSFPSTGTVVQASGKQCSLFNKPISSPATYDDLDSETDNQSLAMSPRHSQNKHQLSLKPIPEMAR